MSETVDLAELTATWPGQATLAVADHADVLGAAGDLDRHFRIASVTKLFTAYAALIAFEEGTIDLDEPAGPSGSTVRHLMSHSSGLRFDDPKVLVQPGQRRIYSNAGIEALADHVAERAEMDFDQYLTMGVLEPLGISGELVGSPAHGMRATTMDLFRLGREVLHPTLLSPDTVAAATSPVFPDLRGVLPGFGPARHNLWGLGFEIRGNKHPHWTGSNQSPETFGHFGGSGSFLWIDRDQGLIGASLSTEGFGPWAVKAWPVANTVMYDRFAR